MISLVVAYARKRVIGLSGGIPWRLPEDSQYFKRLTSGHTVVMGRRTFESIGRPLPRRRNIVLTGRGDFVVPGVEVATRIEEALALAGSDELFVMGGAGVYRDFLDRADRLYITELEADIEGDTFFPAWDESRFQLISRLPGVLDERNTIPHTFLVYERLLAGQVRSG